MTPADLETRFLAYRDAARYLSLPVGTLRSMVHRQTIPYVRMGPQLVRFDRAELDQWIAERAVSKQPRQPRGGGGGASEAHERAIGRLIPNASRRGFQRALSDHTGVAIAITENVIPDAFEFDIAARCLSLYEVIHTHDLTPRKFASLRALRDRLTPAGWSLRLFAASVSDRRMAEVDVDTEEPTIAELLSDAHRVRFEMP